MAQRRCQSRRTHERIDIADDDALRFVQRVLESSAPEADRKAARDMVVAIRTRVLKERAATPPQDKQDAGDGKDAARYRWLRDADRSDPVLPYDELLCFAGESLDAAIDAAIRSGKEAEK